MTNSPSPSAHTPALRRIMFAIKHIDDAITSLMLADGAGQRALLYTNDTDAINAVDYVGADLSSLKSTRAALLQIAKTLTD